VLLLERRHHLRDGRAFALYLGLYTAGRAWIEEVRVDPAHQLFGLRLNFYVAIAVCVVSLLYVVRKGPGHQPDGEASESAEAAPPPAVTAHGTASGGGVPAEHAPTLDA
jgi:prolipoprotein diacylglyceryltransferase